MLHIAHLIERRFGAQRGSRLVAALSLASLSLLLLGLGLMSSRAAAQIADPAALATQALDRLDAGDYAQVEALFGPQMAAAVPALCSSISSAPSLHAGATPAHCWCSAARRSSLMAR